MITGDHELFAKRFGKATPQAVTQFLTFDREYPNSIASSVEKAERLYAEMAAAHREHLPARLVPA